MTRAPLVFRLAIGLALVCLFSLGLFSAEQSKAGKSATPETASTKKTKSSVKKTSKKEVFNPKPMIRRGATASGNAATDGDSQDVEPPPPPDPADELKEYEAIAQSGVTPDSFDGDVRDLPQIPAPELMELDLVEPADYVHNDLPIKQPRLAFNALIATLSAPAPAPLMSFDGMSFLDSYCTGGQCGAGHPPDTNGDVGLKYYIEGINESYAIYDKATGTRLAAFTEPSLWSGQGLGTPCNTSPFGDPIVRYDQTADRWILANLGFVNPGTASIPGPYYECIAVSKSGDPVSGGWWFYAIRIDQSPVPTNTLNDYPKFGVWNDGCVYIGANGFLNAQGSNGSILTTLNKADLYSGATLRWGQAFLSGSANFSLFPANMLGKGSSLPSPSSPEYYVQESNTSNAFNVRKFTPAANCAGGTVSAATAVAHATYNSVGTNIVPQPPPATTANTLDSLGNRIMQPVQYRKVGNAESIWVSHTTRVTNGTTRPQWGQINVTGGTISSTIVQQQIYAPDTTVYRWMSSLAVDNAGNMALGYSVSNNSTVFPGIRYSGRLAGDPLGTLGQTETSIIEGQGSGVFNCGGAVCHRWGDYSSMSVDPVDDCTFWYTNMYYNSQATGSLGNHQTRIASFQLPGCTAVVPDLSITKTHAGSFFAGQLNASYTITVNNNGPGFAFGGVTVSESAPASFIVKSVSGTGWTCSLTSCTRSDNLAAGSSYPAITVTGDVLANSPANIVNSASVSGGTDNTPSNNTASDSTIVNQPAPIAGMVQLIATATLVKLGDGSYQATVKVTNNGTGTALNAVLSTATLGVASGAPTPQSLGNIPPGGGYAIVTETFPSSAGPSGAAVIERYTGTYTGGTFVGGIRATLP